MGKIEERMKKFEKKIKEIEELAKKANMKRRFQEYNLVEIKKMFYEEKNDEEIRKILDGMINFYKFCIKSDKKFEEERERERRFRESIKLLKGKERKKAEEQVKLIEKFKDCLSSQKFYCVLTTLESWEKEEVYNAEDLSKDFKEEALEKRECISKILKKLDIDFLKKYDSQFFGSVAIIIRKRAFPLYYFWVSVEIPKRLSKKLEKIRVKKFENLLKEIEELAKKTNNLEEYYEEDIPRFKQEFNNPFLEDEEIKKRLKNLKKYYEDRLKNTSDDELKLEKQFREHIKSLKGKERDRAKEQIRLLNKFRKCFGHEKHDLALPTEGEVYDAEELYDFEFINSYLRRDAIKRRECLLRVLKNLDLEFVMKYDSYLFKKIAKIIKEEFFPFESLKVRIKVPKIIKEKLNEIEIMNYVNSK